MDAYTDFVCREITHQGRLRGTYEKTSSRGGREKNEKGLETIFFGGGTPSLMSVKQMEKLLVSLENAFGIDWSQVEISMECDPGTFYAGDAERLRRIGRQSNIVRRAEFRRERFESVRKNARGFGDLREHRARARVIREW